jgi:hypothetical protein
VFLAVNHHTDDARIAELAVHSTTLLFWESDLLFWLDAEIGAEEFYAFIRPLNLPEVLWLLRGNLLPMRVLDISPTETLDEVTRDSECDAEFLFLHRMD